MPDNQQKQFDGFAYFTPQHRHEASVNGRLECVWNACNTHAFQTHSRRPFTSRLRDFPQRLAADHIAYHQALKFDAERLCTVFGRQFVKRFALCYQTIRPLSVLSVCPVCDVGELWPNRWIDQDETWHAGRPRSRTHCVRWGPSSPSLKGAQPQFSAHICSVVAKWLHRSRCHLVLEVGLGPGDFVLDGDTAPPPPNGGGVPPQFSAHFYCGHKARCIKMPLGMEVGLSPWEFVLDGNPPLPKRGRRLLPNVRPISRVAKRLDASRCHLLWR